MKTTTKLLAATAFALSMSAASAQAAVFIGISTDGGTTISTVLTDLDDGTFSWSGTAGGFEGLDGPDPGSAPDTDGITVDGNAGLGVELLHSDNVSVNASGAAAITIFVTRTNLSTPNFHGFFSGFTGNTQFGGNFNVTLTTMFDSANGTYTGNTIRTVSYSGFGADSDDYFDTGYNLSGPYSVTHRYDISTASGGSTSPTVTLGGVPEPATWALMIMGFGGAGAMLRRRRMVTA